MAEKVDRLTRVNELIKRELANYLEKFPVEAAENMLVSITEVNTSVDLRNATVSVSVFGGDKIAQRMVLDNLNSSRRDFQSAMARTLGLKHTPVLAFRIDKRVAAGDRVFALLEELESSGSADGEKDE